MGRPSAGSDFIIPVECTGDAVVVPAGGSMRIPFSLLQRSEGANSLLQTVRGMLERRFATLRPGEVAPRAQLRFLVRPDGLRTYYLAWPALEALKVPMTRANISADNNNDR
jgi:hypothetical protein